jgi:hypothetical protein
MLVVGSHVTHPSLGVVVKIISIKGKIAKCQFLTVKETISFPLDQLSAYKPKGPMRVVM